MTLERRAYERINLQALVKTNIGACFIRDVSPGGACVIGPPELKERLDINKVIELEFCTIHGTLLLSSVCMRCRGEVVMVYSPSPYATVFAVKFYDIPTVRLKRG